MLQQQAKLDVMRLLEELLCVNLPLLPETILKLKNLLMNKASIVLCRNKPLLLFHGRQQLYCSGAKISQRTLCLYRLPIWIDGYFVFKCIEKNCKFELRVSLNEELEQDVGTFT